MLFCAHVPIAPPTIRFVSTSLHARSSALPNIRMLAPDAADESAFSMEALASRIAQLKEAPEPEQCRVLVLDSMVPGQSLRTGVPQALLDTIDDNADRPLVMVGRHRLQLHSHGVECLVQERASAPDSGLTMVTLQAGRYCEVVDVGDDEGSRWSGRTGRARWLTLEAGEAGAPEERPTDAIIARAEALEPLVAEWMALVRNGRERSEGQLDQVLKDMGPMPPPSEASRRALWVAGVINPLPALGVALEIRPAALMAPTADLRLQVAEMGLRDSIQRLGSGGEPF